MKKRIITAIIAIAYAVLNFIFMKNSPILIVSLAIFVAIEMSELMNVIGIKSKSIRIPTMVYGALMPIMMTLDNWNYSYMPSFDFKNNFTFAGLFKIITIVYVLFILIALLKHYDNYRFETVATVIFGALCISFSMTCLGKLSQICWEYKGIFSYGDSLFLLIYSLYVCWVFDGGAYFVGSKLGKRRMAPKISPKKSWEGYWGGIIVVEALAPLFLFLFNLLSGANGTVMFGGLRGYIFILIASPLLATLSILGALSASTIKRNFGAKDFGNFFPGHGGILDRFDSVLYVTPIIYSVVIVITMFK